MKTNNFKMIGLILGLSLITSSAFAQNGSSSSAGGGGTGILLKDDTLILADPFVVQKTERVDINKITLPKALIEEIGVGVRGLIVHSGVPSEAVFNQFMRLITDEKIKYYFVKSIPRHCPYQMPELANLPAGSSPVPLACTLENETYIIQDRFEKANLRQQARTLIHEAFRRMNELKFVQEQDAVITRITNGILIVLEKANDERQNRFNPLLPGEKLVLEEMKRTIEQYNLLSVPISDYFKERCANSLLYRPEREARCIEGVLDSLKERVDLSLYQSWPNGGGYVHPNATIDPSASIGITQIVGPDAVIGKNTKFYQSSNICVENCRIGEGAVVFRTHLSNLSNKVKMMRKKKSKIIHAELNVGKNAVLSSVNLVGVKKLDLDADTVLSNINGLIGTQIRGDDAAVKLRERSIIQNVNGLVFILGEEEPSPLDFLTFGFARVAQMIAARPLALEFTGMQWNGAEQSICGSENHFASWKTVKKFNSRDQLKAFCK